jgi:hypothetical protein
MALRLAWAVWVFFCACSVRAGEPTTPGSIPVRGMAIQLASGYQPVETYGKLIREVHELGANTVLLSVAGYMEHARAQGIYADVRRGPTPEETQALIRQGRELGLQVILMPIILLAHPRGSEWRGVIDPPDWDEWWVQYREFIKLWADVAREGGADAFVIGSELVSTEKYTDRWREVIKAVRLHYHGRLSYSANWDHYKPVEFWDELDFISMTSYYTLADARNPTVEQIAERWTPIRKQILDWQSRVNKPILFTEVGWCSQEGAATAPWNYYQNQKATVAGHEEQRRLYEAFLRVWGDCHKLEGVVWWEWTPDPGGAEDFNYTPRGKPAEQVLREWFRGQRSASTTN